MRRNDNHKVVALLLAAILLFSVLFSYEFIPSHTHHDCCGDECPICRVLDVATHTIAGLKAVVVFVAVSLALCTFVQSLEDNSYSFDKTNTLISLKVELLD